jgi:isocitrate dehydrogenase
VKDYARANPHKMGAWTPTTKSHVATMSGGDFYSQREVSDPRRATTLGSSTSRLTARSRCSRTGLAVLPGEVIDGDGDEKKALVEFFEAAGRDARAAAASCSRCT